MIFFELETSDISSLDDGDLRDLVARLCEAELIQRGGSPSAITWGGAQEAADGGTDVSVRCVVAVSDPIFVPRENTSFQVKKHSMGRAACCNEMEEGGKPKAFLEDLAKRKGSYIIVSGKDDCSDKMLSDRISGMKKAVADLPFTNDLHLDFYGRDRLLNWLRRHPSVSLWVRSRLGKPLAGWKPFGRWAATPPLQADNFLFDAHPCVSYSSSSTKQVEPLLDGIHLTRELFREFGSVVRITGLSGVGKTRFAQALFEVDVGQNALPNTDVIYADLGNEHTPSASELVAYLVANDFAAFLVLDNCPPDVHRSLQKQIAQNSAKLRLLTIEYDISDDKPEETDVIYLEPSSEAMVSKLVKTRFPDLDPINADRIAEFAGGNARVALALASRVESDETLSNFSDEDLFQRLFEQRKGNSTELLSSAETLALVYSFSVCRTEYNDELNVLGRISNLARQALHRSHAELLRRQLAQQRGSWRAILPHALANRLARRALENISPDEINEELFKPENLRLFQSCAHRVGYLHDFLPAQALAMTWLRPGAPLGDIASCDEGYLVVLEYIAPVFPSVVISAIERATTNVGFASRENKNFSRFVTLLIHLAYQDESFDRAVEVLLMFAETENADEKNNGIVKQMSQLFSLYLSGTEATPARRQAFIGRLIESGIERHREIAEELLSASFEAHNWTSYGTFHFGARKRGPGWHPENHRESLAWYSAYLELLRPALSSTCEAESTWAKAFVAQHFRSLWSFAGCTREVDSIVRAYGNDGNWPAIWTAIKKTIRFDGATRSADTLLQLESLAQLTAPSNLYAEIEAHALVDEWEQIDLQIGDGDTQADDIHRKVTTLGERAASQQELLSRLAGRLWQTRSQLLWWFGKGLAKGASDKNVLFDFLIISFQQHQGLTSNTLVLEGFIREFYETDSKSACLKLVSAVEMPELRAHGVSLLLAIPITAWTIEKLVELTRGADIDARHFEKISYGRVHEAIPDNELAALLENINELDSGFVSTIRILVMRFHEMGSRGYVPSEELLTVARSAFVRLLSVGGEHKNYGQLHGIARVLEVALNSLPPESEVNEMVGLLCTGVLASHFYPFEVVELIMVFLKSHTEIVLNAVFDGSEREQVLASRIFRERSTRNKSVMNGVPLEKLIKWCGTDQVRIRMVANALDAYVTDVQMHADGQSSQVTVLSSHMKAMFEVSQDKQALVQIIFEKTHPRSWSGSRAEIIKLRSEAFAELLAYPGVDVQKRVKDKIATLQRRIREEREREAAEHGGREQRFE